MKKLSVRTIFIDHLPNLIIVFDILVSSAKKDRLVGQVGICVENVVMKNMLGLSPVIVCVGMVHTKIYDTH